MCDGSIDLSFHTLANMRSWLASNNRSAPYFIGKTGYLAYGAFNSTSGAIYQRPALSYIIK